MPTFKVTLCAFTSALLIGCAGIGVTSTSDPAEKLRDAYYLTERADRPLVAERLIREALDIYARNNDQLGIAEAYKQYGLFFSSDSLAGKWSTYYKNNGFLDKTVSYDGRYTKAIEYLEKARAILRELQKYDALTNVNYNLALANYRAGQQGAACDAFMRTAESYRQNIEHNPGAKPIYPNGYASFPEFLDAAKQRFGCA